MNGAMTRRTGLILLRQVVGRPNRPLHGSGVALQAKQTGLADP